MARPLYADNVPTEDAEVVRRLKAAGAIVLAKTNTPEFAAGANTVNPVFGATRNPWNTAFSPAGSSGGSAAAVASGMLPIAQGTDFGCSVRIPRRSAGSSASARRPAHAELPDAAGLGPGQVHGPLARTAEDAAMMLDAIVGFTRLSPISVAPPWPSAAAIVSKTRDAKGLRIAFTRDIAGIGVDSEIEAICRKAASQLREQGATVDEIEFDLSGRTRPLQDLAGRLDGRPAARKSGAAR